MTTYFDRPAGRVAAAATRRKALSALHRCYGALAIGPDRKRPRVALIDGIRELQDGAASARDSDRSQSGGREAAITGHIERVRARRPSAARQQSW